MLYPATLYRGELRRLLEATMFDPKYVYYHGAYFKDLVIASDTWNEHQFVSVNEKGKVFGYIGYHISHRTFNVTSLSIIHFTNEDNITFGRDVYQATDDIFCKFNYNKLNHSVLIGNPIEKTYDKLHKRYGGRIVGVLKDEVRLMTGVLVDEKIYEITKQDYLRHRRSNI